MKLMAYLTASGLALGLAACGGGGGGGAASCTPGPTAAITITATGPSPQNVCVLPASGSTSGTVTFTNGDTVAHTVEFGAVGCPTVGAIAPGAAATATFTTSENCTFRIDGGPGTGTVAVTTGVVTGGGY